MLDGERPRRVAQAHAGAPATMVFTWQTTMGVGVPADASVVLAPPPDAALLPGGAALTSAISAHRAALDAALRAAVESAAHERLAAELVATVRRVRAIESRWLPLHEQSLAALEQTLDENDRGRGGAHSLGAPPPAPPGALRRMRDDSRPASCSGVSKHERAARAQSGERAQRAEEHGQRGNAE